MVRVPTYATYMNLMNGTLANKAQFDLYNYQSITGLKSPTYSGYGMSAYSIVSLEASLTVTKNFMETNDILNIELKTMNTSIDAVSKAIADFKSSLTSFSGMDLDKITPDYTGGEISFTSNNDVYNGKTLTIDGTQYTFRTAEPAGGWGANDIDISGLTPGSDTYGADVMAALEAKLPANDEFKFDGNKFTFPLYTIDGASSVLNAAGVTTGEPHEMSDEQAQVLQQLQNLAFTTMQVLTDSLNTSANGKYLFGGGVSINPPVNFPFTTLEQFQQYYDGVNVKYPGNSSANLSTREVDGSQTGDITLELDADGGNKATITAANAGAFLTPVIKGGEKTTGDLSFNAADNTIKATEYGAFNTLSAGDTLVIGGNDAGANAKSYIIKSVSADGKTVTVEESTPIAADMTIADGGDAQFSTSFPVGSVINLDGFGNNVAPQAQVTGVSPDGTELYITVDPNRFPANGAAVTVPGSGKWSISSESYYQGGQLASEKRISENQSVTMDITAGDPAFEQLFRALGEIAQGNLVNLQNPADMTGSEKIDAQSALDRVEEALTLIKNGTFNGAAVSNSKNPDLYTVQAKLNANTVVLKNTLDNQTLVKTNLESNVSSLKNVDKTEAAVKALLAQANLSASYSVLQVAMGTSLLNYLK